MGRRCKLTLVLNTSFIEGFDWLYSIFQIAVDEIFLSDTECPPEPFCDFETSFCGWTNDTTAQFYWTRMQKATDSFGTGPSAGMNILSQKYELI